MKLIGLIIYVVGIAVLAIGAVKYLERPRSRHKLNRKIKNDDWFNDKENGL